MKKKIFQSILNVTIIVLLSSLILVTGVLHNYFGKIQNKQLKNELLLAAIGTEQEGLDYPVPSGLTDNPILLVLFL